MMILRERCDVDQETRDQHGDIILTTVAESVPCEMSPIDSVEQAVNNTVTTRYRIHLRRNVLTAARRVLWRGAFYAVEGNVETHTISGRLHHFEAVLVRYGV